MTSRLSKDPAPRLTGWSHRPRVIGGRLLLGRTVLFEVLEVGRAGRPQDRAGLVSVLVRDGFGLEQRLELPLAAGANAGTLMRMDRVEARTIAATNLSARGRPVPLGDAADWFPAPRIGPLSAIACALGAAILLRLSGVAGAAVGLSLMAPACCTLLRGMRAERCRAQLRDYMQAICSHRAATLPAAAPRLSRTSVPLVARAEALA